VAKTRIPEQAGVTRYVHDLGEYRWVSGIETLVGDVAVPGYIEADFLPAKDGPGLFLVVEIEGGVPGCTTAEFYSQEGGSFVRPKPVEWLARNLDNIVEDMVRQASVRFGPGGAVTYPQSAADRAATSAAATSLMKGSRRRQTPAHFQRVVKVYREAENGREAVKKVFQVEYRTADRWIKKARDGGYFDEPGEIEAVDISPEAQRERADAALAAMNRRTGAKGGDDGDNGQA